MLPSVYKILRDLLNTRLKQAETISLVANIWTNTIIADVLGLIACVTYEFGYSEILVIGMQNLKDKHESENIQMAIEFIVNQYDFDQKKIICK